MNCIVCETKIEEGYFPCSIDVPPYQKAWNDGTVDKIVPGYGSSHDNERLIIGICDSCISAKLENGVIIKERT